MFGLPSNPAGGGGGGPGTPGAAGSVIYTNAAAEGTTAAVEASARETLDFFLSTNGRMYQRVALGSAGAVELRAGAGARWLLVVDTKGAPAALPGWLATGDVAINVATADELIAALALAPSLNLRPNARVNISIAAGTISCDTPARSLQGIADVDLSKVRITGAAPVETTLSSVGAVTQVNGFKYSAPITVADASNIEVGDLVIVAPLTGTAGPWQALAGCWPVTAKAGNVLTVDIYYRNATAWAPAALTGDLIGLKSVITGEFAGFVFIDSPIDRIADVAIRPTTSNAGPGLMFSGAKSLCRSLRRVGCHGFGAVYTFHTGVAIHSGAQVSAADRVGIGNFNTGLTVMNGGLLGGRALYDNTYAARFAIGGCNSEGVIITRGAVATLHGDSCIGGNGNFGLSCVYGAQGIIVYSLGNRIGVNNGAGGAQIYATVNATIAAPGSLALLSGMVSPARNTPGNNGSYIVA